MPQLTAPPPNDERKLRVLVADADTPSRARMVKLLTRDCQVICAETVRLAKWLVRRYHFDLLFCDLELPQSGGIALLYYVEMLAPETMAIMLMAQPDRQMTRIAIRYGAFDCYVKPVTEETIQRLLDLIRTRSQNRQ